MTFRIFRWKTWLCSFLFAAIAGVIWAYPVLAAVGCPACYGMEQAAPRLIVNSTMPLKQRRLIEAYSERAIGAISRFYGSFERLPIVIACSDSDCDRRMGGRGALAVTISTPFGAVVRISPPGIDQTILIHEFSHVELHRRIGFWSQITGAVPAWLDEGVAVIVSDDSRYLKSGDSARERCLRERSDSLPSSSFEWGRLAGRTPAIYADAACRVLHWMERNGGRSGLVQAIEDVAQGKRLPE